MEENDCNIYGDSSTNVLTELFVQHFQKFLKLKYSIFQKFLNPKFLSDPITKKGLMPLNFALFQTNMPFSMQIFNWMSEGNHNIANHNGI